MSIEAIPINVAEMQTEIDAARLDLSCSLAQDKGSHFTKEAATAKLYASECYAQHSKMCADFWWLWVCNRLSS